MDTQKQLNVPLQANRKFVVTFSVKSLNLLVENVSPAFARDHGMELELEASSLAPFEQFRRNFFRLFHACLIFENQARFPTVLVEKTTFDTLLKFLLARVVH